MQSNWPQTTQECQCWKRLEKKTKGEREIGKLWLGNYPNLNENNEL